MAHLLIDIGNTNIKWCEYRSALGPVRRQSHVKWDSYKNFADWFERQCAEHSMPDRVLVSNVAGKEIEDYLSRWCVERWALSPTFIQAKATQLGVENGYKRPAQLGADRWMALLAARQLAPDGAIVVDCGTTITIDLLNGQGIFQGGLIMPGADLNVESLLKSTSDIAALHRQTAADKIENQAPGRSTQSCVINGALFAAQGGVGHAINVFKVKSSDNLTILATGGAAGDIFSGLDFEVQVVPDLVFQGLALIADVES